LKNNRSFRKRLFIKTENGSDATSVVKIFEYGFAEGLRTKMVSGQDRILKSLSLLLS
jgi:hypothetical protein